MISITINKPFMDTIKLTILANDIKTDGVNEPLFRLGLMGVFFGVLGIVFAISLGNMLNLDGLTGLPEG